MGPEQEQKASSGIRFAGLGHPVSGRLHSIGTSTDAANGAEGYMGLNGEPCTREELHAQMAKHEEEVKREALGALQISLTARFVDTMLVSRRDEKEIYRVASELAAVIVNRAQEENIPAYRIEVPR